MVLRRSSDTMSECQDLGRDVVNRTMLLSRLKERSDGARMPHLAAPSRAETPFVWAPFPYGSAPNAEQAISLPFERLVFSFALQTPSLCNKPQYMLDPSALVAPLPKKPQVCEKRE